MRILRGERERGELGSENLRVVDEGRGRRTRKTGVVFPTVVVQPDRDVVRFRVESPIESQDSLLVSGYL